MGSRGRICALPELGCARADAPLHLPGGVSRVRTRLGNLAIQFEVRLPFVYRNPVFAANRCSLVGKFADERCDTAATHSAALHGRHAPEPAANTPSGLLHIACQLEPSDAAHMSTISHVATGYHTYDRRASVPRGPTASFVYDSSRRVPSKLGMVGSGSAVRRCVCTALSESYARSVLYNAKVTAPPGQRNGAHQFYRGICLL